MKRFQQIGDTIIQKAKEAGERVVKQSLAYPESTVRSSGRNSNAFGQQQLVAPERNSLVQEHHEIDMMHHVIEDRDKQINQIHNIFENIHGIAKEINVEVYQQGDKVKSLHTNVTDAAQNIKDGNGELVEAEKSQKSGCKWLAICLAVLIIIIIIVCISLFN